MLDVSPDNLFREVEQAEKLRDRILTIGEDMIRDYAGVNYRDDWEPDDPVRENHPWEYVVNTVPKLVYNNPQMSVSSRRPRIQRELVQAMRHGLNRWVADVDLADTLNAIAYDVMFEFGVGMVTL